MEWLRLGENARWLSPGQPLLPVDSFHGDSRLEAQPDHRRHHGGAASTTVLMKPPAKLAINASRVMASSLRCEKFNYELMACQHACNTALRHGRLRVGVAGPVGSGKTALVEALCRNLRHQLQLAVVTNDIYTQEDAQFLTRLEPWSRIASVVLKPVGAPYGDP